MLTQRDEDNLFRYQINKLPVRNFKPSTLQIIFSLDEFKELYSKMKPGETIQVEVNQSYLRSQIHSFCFLKCEVESITKQNCDFNKGSTIFFHFKCKGATPYNQLEWISYYDDEIGFDESDAHSNCPKCNDSICSDSIGRTYTLNRRHNVMKIRKLLGIRHNNCGNILKIEELDWKLNSYHEECSDAICKYCEDVPICSQCKYPGKNSDGEIVDSDDINGFTYV